MNLLTEQPALFDYAALDSETRTILQEQEAELDCVLKRTSEEIGVILLKVKQLLPHGKYMPWLASRGISESTAWRCIQVAQGKPITKSFKMKDLPLVESSIREAKQQSDLFAIEYAPTETTLFDRNSGGENEDDMVVATPAKSATLTALQSSDTNEWYTPADYVDAARHLMGTIDVDPASCERANQVVKAKQYYTKRQNGLVQSWNGRVWLNPPYGFDGGTSNQELWTRQLIERYAAGLVSEAVLLVNANTEAKWFQPLYDYLICFTNHRIRFYNAAGESNQPTQGNALVYFGKQQRRFIELFSRFGRVIQEVKLNEC